MTNQRILHLPKCLAYLEEPYLSEDDEEIVVAQLSDEKIRGIEGLSKIYTALVPLNIVEEVLESKGGIGYTVCGWQGEAEFVF